MILPHILKITTKIKPVFSKWRYRFLFFIISDAELAKCSSILIRIASSTSPIAFHFLNHHVIWPLIIGY